MRDDSVIYTQDLSRSFSGRLVVDSVGMTVRRGEVYGLIGANGAGKTTLISVILGLLTPSGGTVSLFGTPFGARRVDIRRRIGVVQDRPCLYPDMTGTDYLTFFAELQGVAASRRRANDMLELFDLASAGRQRLATYSRGMQQKISLARALIHDPDLLILDEPASGLDPLALRDLRNLIAGLRASGCTVFMSSHHLTENERICDRVGFMSGGRLVHEGGVADTLKTFQADSLESVFLATAGKGNRNA